MEQASLERQREPAIWRIFDKVSEEKKLKADTNIMKAQNEYTRNLIEEKKSRIDIAPNNTEEQTALLKELNLEKKEPQIKKHEINEQMREIHTDARKKSVKLPSTLRGVLSRSQHRASVRRTNRYQAEATPSPHEDARGDVELELFVWKRHALGRAVFVMDVVESIVDQFTHSGAIYVR